MFSAGNGAAMRAPILGACLAYTPDRIEPMLQAVLLVVALVHGFRRILPPY